MEEKKRSGNLCGNLNTDVDNLKGNIKYATNSDNFEHLKPNLKVAEELLCDKMENETFINLRNFSKYGLGDFKTAIGFQERCLKLATQLGWKSSEKAAYCNIGVAYHGMGDFKTALFYFEQYLKIAKELGDRSGEGKAYGNLGVAHNSLGNFDTAKDYIRRRLKIAKELGDRFEEGRAYCHLGIAQLGQGNFQTAIVNFERHLKIAKELGDKSGEGNAYGHLGIAHRNLADYKTAIDYHEHALKIATELGERSTEGKAYGNLGSTHTYLGDFKTALDYYERHLKIAKEMGDRFGKGGGYYNIGIILFTLRDFKAAIDNFERSLKIWKELGNKSGEGRAYHSLGGGFFFVREFKTSIEYFQRGLKIAKELGDRSLEGMVYGNLGIVHRSFGEVEKAIEYHKIHMTIAKELGDTLGELKACINLGRSFELIGQVSVAIEYYEDSISLLNNIRERLDVNDEWKITLCDQYKISYNTLWRLILAQGKVTEALFSAEQGRAQGLKDLMELKYALKKSGEYEGSGTEKGTVNAQLGYLPQNTIFIAFECNEVIFWVCQRGKDVELRKKQVHSQDEVSIFFQALLRVGQRQVGTRNLLKCEDRSLELASNKSLVAKRSPQDERQAQHFDLTKDALSTLYEIIIEPIQDILLDSELIFVPEGPLCLAPFAAFKGPDSKYLSESFKIRVAPSLTSLKMIADCPLDYHHKTGALLLGDPLTELSRLPCARKEVEMLGRMLGVTPLIGEQASKDEVLRRLSSVALVHIAAHGNMETGEIALASTKGVKMDILTMRDVLGVQMRARLVVLSCCHSARGEIKAEGVVGIARAFLGAGARSVLVSLWVINDEATLEFMKNFYQHLVKGISASESLNQTMNCMRGSEKFNAVKYWAPFVLIGDDVILEFAGNE